MKNLNDISKTVAIKMNLQPDFVKKITTETFEEIANTLTKGNEEVRIKNFATFFHSRTAAKNTKHPITKQPIFIDSKKTIRLSLSTKIKKALNPGGSSNE